MASVIEGNNAQHALSLYREALDISRQIQAPFAIASILSMMSAPLLQTSEYQKALECLIEAFNIFGQLQAKQESNSLVSRLQIMRITVEENEFDTLWKQITDSDVPDFLSQSPQQSLSAEQFIAWVIKSAREKRPEAEEYFKSAQKMAADSSVPAEMRELGRVLQRIMIGDKNVDLSSLPKEWAEMIQRMNASREL